MSNWRTINVGSHAVEVSEHGLIRINGRIRSTHITSRGYERVAIGGVTRGVHRLVAMAFVENPSALNEVNHLDGNKRNNCFNNLEWCDRSRNMKHAYSIGLHPGVKKIGADHHQFGKSGNLHKQSKPVIATFPDGTQKVYASQGETARDGFSPEKVNHCIRGRRKSHGGATWQPLPAAPEEGG